MLQGTRQVRRYARTRVRRYAVCSAYLPYIGATSPNAYALTWIVAMDLYHWSSAKFSSTWYDTLSVLVAKGRAQVGVAASSGDWSKRIRDMQYTDHEDYTMGS